MNTDTGHIYRKPGEIEAAKARKEPLRMITSLQANKIEKEITRIMYNLKYTQPNLTEDERYETATKKAMLGMK